MSESTYRITGTKGSIFKIKVRGIQHGVLIDINTGAFGPISAIAEIVGVSGPTLNHHIIKISSRYPPAECYAANVGTSTHSRLCSLRIINAVIDRCIERQLTTPGVKTRFNKLYKEVRKFCSPNDSRATSTATIDVDDNNGKTSDSLQRIEALEQTVKRLTHIIDRIVEAHPEITLDEPAVVDKELIDNYMVVVCKNEDGSLAVETLSPDDDLTDKDPLFSKEFYVSINDVDNLLTKLRDKKIITSQDEETIIVDDADFFVSAFSYKLSKISDKNKESEVESTSAVSISN